MIKTVKRVAGEIDRIVNLLFCDVNTKKKIFFIYSSIYKRTIAVYNYIK